MVIYRLKTVISIIGLSRSFVYSSIKSGGFPPPVKIGRRAVGWLKSDIDQWLITISQQKNTLGGE